MKRILFRTGIAAMCGAAVLSCTKSEMAQSGHNIVFGVGGEIDGLQSKTALTNENISTAGTVYVYGTKDATAISALNGSQISKNATTGYWYPATSVQWTDGSAYVFRAYAYNGAPTVSTDGKTVTVTEPSTYDESSFIDYLFSDEVKVSATESANHPTIDLKLSHVFPSVEFYVLKDKSMKTVNVTAMSVTGLFNKGEAKYESGAWNTTPSGNATDATYSISGTFKADTTMAKTAAAMKIITIAQQLTEECKLTVTYEVDESSNDETVNMKSHTESFILSNYGKTNLLHGHRAIFYLTVDTGIHLQATIVPWVKVDFIEGTVLPAI